LAAVRVPRFIEAAVDWLRYELPKRLPKLPDRVNRPVLVGVGLAALLIAAIWAIASIVTDDDEVGEAETRIVTVAVETDDASEAPVGPLGFPLVATRNTTRVGGPDPASDAAATALATHPRTSDAEPIEAAVLVGGWQAGVAASVLAGPPLRAPLLVGESGGVPDPTADALAKLKPRGGSGPADVAVYIAGDASAPSGLQSEKLDGGSPAEIANSVDELRAKLTQAEPEHILVASGEAAAYAMPAASWAARSGDPVFFAGSEELPDATAEALRRHRGKPVYLLGPESVISAEVEREIERISPGVQRVGADNPVENAIAFARYTDSSFGWNINDPGHGLVLANAERPLDAAAGAVLSASGKWGPLLVLQAPGTLPPELRSFLLDIKPGFEDDPTRALYNHVWLLGDATAVGARVQAEVDELAELTEVGAGAGGPIIEGPGGPGAPGLAVPGGPEDEPLDQGGGKNKDDPDKALP
jgi:hypothetical protein